MVTDARRNRVTKASIQRIGKYLLAEPFGRWLDPFHVVRVTGRLGGPHGFSVEPDHISLFRRVLLEPGQTGVQLWRGMRTRARRHEEPGARRRVNP